MTVIYLASLPVRPININKHRKVERVRGHSSMYCRAGHGSATSRGGDNGLDLVECAKRLKDEGIDASLSLDAIIALQASGSDLAALELEAGPSSPSREKEDAPPQRRRAGNEIAVRVDAGDVSV